jgi:hypothetical protein
MQKTRIIVLEDGADLLRDEVVREPLPSTELVEFRGPDPGLVAWREACERDAERMAGTKYLPPGRRAA